MTATASNKVSPEQAQALVFLCSQVLPVWARQLASSRSQSETAVTEMLGAFAAIGPHLDRASRQSQQIGEALTQADGITQLGQACELALQPVLAELDVPSRAAVLGVIAMVHTAVDALAQMAKPFDHETQMVSRQVDRMYQGFQYQDRISQMMTLLHDDIERLRVALDQPGAVLDAPAWLARLESNYVMNEQRQQHTDDGAAGSAADNEETTFF